MQWEPSGGLSVLAAAPMPQPPPPLAISLKPLPPTPAVPGARPVRSPQAQQAPSLANNPANSLRFVSGQDSGFVTVAHSGSAANMSSQLTVSYYDSTGAQLYAFTKGNPRKMPIIPLDEQGGVETVLDMDSDKATVSPVVAGAPAQSVHS